MQPVSGLFNWAGQKCTNSISLRTAPNFAHHIKDYNLNMASTKLSDLGEELEFWRDELDAFNLYKF